jgi:hypothetical protein
VAWDAEHLWVQSFDFDLGRTGRLYIFLHGGVQEAWQVPAKSLGVSTRVQYNSAIELLLWTLDAQRSIAGIYCYFRVKFELNFVFMVSILSS